MVKSGQFNAAIHYDADGYRFDKQIMGRQSAGKGFLQALCQQPNTRELVGWCRNQASATSFREDVRQYAGQGCVEARIISQADTRALAQQGVLYTPGPDLSALAWQRARYAVAAWSLCGVTHTTCSANVMDSISSYLSTPVQAWDALVCTSSAAHSVVTKLLDRQQDYLTTALGAHQFVRPMLPIIPLGVNCNEFDCEQSQRVAARAQLGVAETDLVVLFAGRLSFHAKANPLPMYLALQQLSSQYRIHMVHFGVFANQGLENAFKQAAQSLCPQVTCHWLDGAQDSNKQVAWQSADVFCSLSDNIQETFGLTPIEAMAAGLPQVVTDWNGYQDTVRHGVDGFRVRTAMPDAGYGMDLATRYADQVDNFDYYVGHVSQFVGVDVAQCVDYFGQLFGRIELRSSMGLAARQRALAEYDWPRIASAYQALWSEQNDQRLAVTDAPVYVTPARPDPYDLYASYASCQINGATSVRLLESVSEQQLVARRELFIVKFAEAVWPDMQLCTDILAHLQSIEGAVVVTELCGLKDPLQPASLQSVVLAVAWLYKQGWLQISAV